MEENRSEAIKKVIADNLGSPYAEQGVKDDLKLVGNILDSMAVTQLITSLEERFDFMFDEEDLSAETFETVGSLIEMVTSKLEG